MANAPVKRKRAKIRIVHDIRYNEKSETLTIVFGGLKIDADGKFKSRRTHIHRSRSKSKGKSSLPSHVALRISP